jgi:hypothetical protein
MAVGQSSFPAGMTAAPPLVMPATMQVETDSGTPLSLRERFWVFWHRRDTLPSSVRRAYPTTGEVVQPRAALNNPGYPTTAEGDHTAEPPLLRPSPQQPLPSGPAAEASGETEGSAPTTVTAEKPAIEVSKPNENKVGAAEDYTWITGQLFYVHAEGGRWVVRYASVGQVDRYGGSVVLAPGVEMKNFREGDVVCVHGQVLNEGRTSPHLGGAL